MLKFRKSYTLFSFSCVGVVGILSIFGPSQTPEDAAKNLAKVFAAQDAAAFEKIIHPDIVEGKEVRGDDVKQFLSRYAGRVQDLERVTIHKRLTSEDGKTKRVEASLLFKSAPLAPELPGHTVLETQVLFVLDNGKWWFERPLFTGYRIEMKSSYPTPEQDETAMRFNAAIKILEKIGLSGKEDMPFTAAAKQGVASADYRELEKLHQKEKGPKGVDPDARGVDLLLKAAAKSQGGLLQIYHGDFRANPDDRRSPVPWDMFRDYVQAALKRARIEHQRGNAKTARVICRLVISLGRQFLDEPGGYHFLSWGIAFQKAGAEQLARLGGGEGAPDRQSIESFVNLCSRRIDLLRTALGCLDDLSEYRALKAAITAAQREGDPVFRPWGINTLAILALKGAPARPEIIQQVQTMVLVSDPGMQQTALTALDRLASEPNGRLRPFIEFQKNWIRAHKVYGTTPAPGDKPADKS
ncbi:MAG: nuclear transport factor 2 family protein [Desulfomonile sp.]|nr:nuclear transport factor 2 family protein [Desulfomonile sp.]